MPLNKEIKPNDLKKYLHKNVNINVKWMQFPKFYVWNNPRQADISQKSIN